jgi:hypothetical protein
LSFSQNAVPGLQTSAHLPATQLWPALHASPQSPQLFASVCTLVHVSPHNFDAVPQSHALQPQFAEQTRRPVLPHVSLWFGAHSPWPRHAPQVAMPVSPLHVLRCVPQRSQLRVAGSLHFWL